MVAQYAFSILYLHCPRISWHSYRLYSRNDNNGAVDDTCYCYEVLLLLRQLTVQHQHQHHHHRQRHPASLSSRLQKRSRIPEHRSSKLIREHPPLQQRTDASLRQTTYNSKYAHVGSGLGFLGSSAFVADLQYFQYSLMKHRTV